MVRPVEISKGGSGWFGPVQAGRVSFRHGGVRQVMAV